MKKPMTNTTVTLKQRRDFLSTLAAGTFAATIIPRHVLGGPGHIAPSERIRVASIGVGGMGGGDVGTISRLGAEIVALCDVDQIRGAGSFNTFSNAMNYKDFRIMLDKEANNIDAVTVGTPDHTHAVATMAAIKAGKNVYCQKPLTQTIYEAREVTKAAKSAGVITSMGNQGHATEGARLTNEWIRAGVIGEVTEVHAWSDRAGSKAWEDRRAPLIPPKLLIGTCGLGPVPSDPTTQLTPRIAGGVGGTLGQERLGIWVAIFLITPFGLWNWMPQLLSKRAPHWMEVSWRTNAPISKLTQLRQSSIIISLPKAADQQSN
jgi:hypothetical protein